MMDTPVSVIESWLTFLQQEGRSPHTIAAYRRAMVHFVAWSQQAYGDVAFDPAAIIPRDIQDWKSYQQRCEKAAPATFNLRLVALASFFKWAEDRSLVQSNPVQHVKS